MTSTVAADPEVAASADGFVDSIGVGTHHLTHSGPYAEATIDRVDQVLGELGVRHIRTDIHGGPVFPARLDAIYAEYGVRTDAILNRRTEEISLATQIQTATEDPAIDLLEGANEPDNARKPYTYTDLQGGFHVDDLAGHHYDATTSLQRDAASLLGEKKPLLSPAMANPILTHFLAGIPCDAVAAHPYPQGRLPGNSGLDWAVLPALDRIAPVSSGTALPVYASESGYHTASAYKGGAQPGVTLAAQAKYLPRMFAEYFNRGMVRTYSYDLIDDRSDPTDKEANFGLVNFDFSPKPAFIAEKNMIALLREARWDKAAAKWVGLPSFSPGALDYSLKDAPPFVHHTLLQKSDGVFYLLLWQEVPSCDNHQFPYADIDNPPVDVTLNLKTPILQAQLYQPNLSPEPQQTISQPDSLQLSVADQLLIVKLTPVSSPAPETLNSPPVVSLRATGGNAPVDVLSSRPFTLYRTGPLDRPLSVPYQLRQGTTEPDSPPVLATAVFPIGAATVTIPGPQSAGAKFLPGGILEATLQKNGSFSSGANTVSRVRFPSLHEITGFEDGTLDSWTSQTQASLAIENSIVDTGAHALKWTYHNTDPKRIPYQGEIHLNFPTPQDWSQYTKVIFRFAADEKNPSGDIGRALFFNFDNRNVRVTGGWPVDSFTPDGTSGYRTVELDLLPYPRDQVTSIFFFATGGRWGQGDHVWYLDNISLQ